MNRNPTVRANDQTVTVVGKPVVVRGDQGLARDLEDLLGRVTTDLEEENARVQSWTPFGSSVASVYADVDVPAGQMGDMVIMHRLRDRFDRAMIPDSYLVVRTRGMVEVRDGSNEGRDWNEVSITLHVQAMTPGRIRIVVWRSGVPF